MKEVGNLNARLRYERWVPPSYRRVDAATPQILVEQYIFAKYAREEFIHPERQSYTSGQCGTAQKTSVRDPNYSFRIRSLFLMDTDLSSGNNFKTFFKY